MREWVYIYIIWGFFLCSAHLLLGMVVVRGVWFVEIHIDDIYYISMITRTVSMIYMYVFFSRLKFSVSGSGSIFHSTSCTGWFVENRENVLTYKDITILTLYITTTIRERTFFYHIELKFF